MSGYDESTGIPLTGWRGHNVVVVDADCRYSNTGEGLHRFVDPVDDEVYLYSQFETADAKRMFACFDQPDLKAAFDVTVTAPAHWQVISNGATVDRRRRRRRPSGTRSRPPPRMSTYLVALIAGPYARWDDVYSDEHGDIPLGIFCRSSLAEFMDAERLFTETKQGFGFYHDNFGTPYAFGKYDQLFVPEFNAGAMENAGAVTFLEDYVFRSKVTRYSYERRAETVLHEMAHMWFGDLVTMQWWDDLWLNESFATFASVLCQAEATEYTQAWTTFANVEKSWAYRQDQLPSTHPVAADIPDLHAVEVNFDGITYAKGASVLKQLVAYVGLERFPRRPAGLLPRPRVRQRDLRRSARRAGEVVGTRPVGLGSAVAEDHRAEHAAARTSTSTPTARSPASRSSRAAPSPAPARPGCTGWRSASTTTTPPASWCGCTARSSTSRARRPKCLRLQGVPRGKLILVNDDDLTYCSLRLDPDSLQTVLSRIADIAEPLPRTLAWSAAWEMTRDAELRARDFVALVMSGLHAESEVGVAQRLLLQAQTALGSYADPGMGGRERVAGVRRSPCWTWPRDSAPGSDHQLAFVNALCTSVLSSNHVAVLSTLLDNEPAAVNLPGLVIDTDLRWRIVTALARAGVLDADGPATPFIDAEAGNRSAPPRAAGMPPQQPRRGRSRRSRNAAWQTGHRGRHAGQHHRARDHRRFRPTGPGRAAGAVPRPLLRTRSPGCGTRRSSEVAQTVVVGLYPSWDISADALDAADRFLADPEVPPALRRLVLEGRAGVERSLRARALRRQLTFVDTPFADGSWRTLAAADRA